ncbi:MAG: class I SAM-dependent methyltransferase [Phycisphaerales bacterium]|nr:MAG: class I SAM-dependent methyltransferase [Phycisphaerales bacterium]
MSTNTVHYRSWEYARRGDYHRELAPNWSYTPTYLQKMRFIRRFVDSLPRTARILDAGCGEGVLVEEFRAAGRNIVGMDLNYESDCVRRGDIRDTLEPDSTFDAVLLLDVFEHLAYADQPRALREIHRILKPAGRLVISVPNLAHLNSRLTLLFTGRLDRTDKETDHVGERPLAENARLLAEAGFQVGRWYGITFTVPIIYRRIVCKWAERSRWLHDALGPLARLLPSLAMLNIAVCRKANGHAERIRM